MPFNKTVTSEARVKRRWSQPLVIITNHHYVWEMVRENMKTESVPLQTVGGVWLGGPTRRSSRKKKYWRPSFALCPILGQLHCPCCWFLSQTDLTSVYSSTQGPGGYDQEWSSQDGVPSPCCILPYPNILLHCALQLLNVTSFPSRYLVVLHGPWGHN